MPRPRGWKDLLPGLLALLALVGGAAAVLVFARVGALRGRKLRLYATVQEARGLSSGSEVWLAGERIGTVSRIAFLPPSADTTQRLLVTLDVLERHRSVIRRGAEVRVQPGGNLIGAPVVTIALGAPGQPPVTEGDTLHAPPEEDVDRARAEFQTAAAAVPPIIANMRVLATQLRATSGTLGALGIEGRGRLARVGATAQRTMATVTAGRGSVARMLDGRGGARYAREALARVDTVRALLLAPGGTHSIGRFRRDSTLLREVEAIRADLAVATRLLDESRGTAGRLQHDSALAAEVAQSRRALSALAADLRRNPLRYLAF